jgi:hypothetical protein
MAVPPLNHPCWHRLAGGALSNIRTQHLGTQLMSKRMQRSADPVEVKAAELHAFFSKWERALANEVSQLTTA